MERFIEGVDRGPLSLLPENLDRSVEDGNIVRVSEAFVDALDLCELRFKMIEPAEPPPGVRVEAQSGGDMAQRTARARSQDDRQVPQRQRHGDQKTCARFVEPCRRMGPPTKATHTFTSGLERIPAMSFMW